MQGTQGCRKFWEKVMPLILGVMSNRFLRLLSIYIVVGAFSVIVGQQILRAVSTDWSFDVNNDPSSNYTISDSTALEFVTTADNPPYAVADDEGVVRLKKLDTYTDTSDTEWNNGTNGVYTGTNTTVDSNTLQLDKYAKPSYGTFTAQPMSGAEPGLFIHWDMEEASGATIDNALYLGVHSSTAVGTNATGGLTYAQTGKFSNTFQWNGNNNLSTSSRLTRANDNETVLNGTNYGTISMWVYPTSFATNDRTFVSRWASTTCPQIATEGRQWRLFAAATSGNLSFDFYDSGNTLRTITGPALTASVWSHIAITKDATGTNSKWAMYLNGKRVATATALGVPRNVTTSQLVVGADRTANLNNHCWNNVLAGKVDDFAFFQAFKRQEDIRQYYGDYDLRTAVYTFDAQNGNDATGWANTLTGTATYTDISGEKPGFGYAATFNGSQSLELNPATVNSLFDPAYEATLETWVKPTTLPGSGNDVFLMTTMGGPANKLDLRLTTNASGSFLKVGWGGTTYVGRRPITTGTWYHVAAVFARDQRGTTMAAVTGGNEGKVRLYVNGVFDSQTTLGAVLNYGDSYLRLGRDSAAANGYNGLMDETMFFNRARSQEELLEDAMMYKTGGTYRSAGRNTGTFDAGKTRQWNTLSWNTVKRYGQGASVNDANVVYLYNFDQSAAPFANQKSPGTPNLTSVGTVQAQGVMWNPDSPTSNPPRAMFVPNTNANGLTSDAVIPSLSTYTIETYVRFGVAAGAAVDTVLSISSGATENPRIWRDANEKINLTIGGGTITGTHDFQDTRWHHIAAVVSGTNADLYVDGILEATSTTIGAASGSNYTLYIGDSVIAGNQPFTGAVDEVVIYNTNLNLATIQDHYRRMIMNVRFLSHSCAAVGASCNNADFKGYDGTTGKYSTPVATNDAGLVVLWDFNETSYNHTLNEVQDTQTNGSGKDGTAFGVKTSSDALFGRSAVFNGISDYVTLTDNAASTPRIDPSLGLFAWVKIDEEFLDLSTSPATILTKQYTTTTSSYQLLVTNLQQLQFRYRTTDGVTPLARTLTSTTEGVVPVGEWVLLGATYSYNGTNDNYDVNIWVNDVSVNATTETNAYVSMQYDTGPFFVGYNPVREFGTSFSPFKGKIDAMMMYHSRILTQSDITAMYARGNPNHYMTKNAGQDPAVADGRYFQYKTYLTSDGSESPQLSDVFVKSTTFDAFDPYIETKAGNAKSYVRFDTFTETLGPNAPYNAETRYIFKNGAGAWYWWDPVQVPANKWVSSNASYAQATAVSDLTIANFRLLDEAIGANGTLHWRMFFHSPTGEEYVEVDNLNIVDAGATLTLTAPEGQTLVVGDQLDITWDFLVATDVKIEWSTDDFVTPHELTASVPTENATGGCTDPGVGSGCFRTTVPDGLGTTFKIRLTDVSAAPEATPDSSNPANTVDGKMEITYPVGTETLVAGTVYTITWTAYGSTGAMAGNNTKIQLDPDSSGGFGGGDVVTLTSIAENAANTTGEGSCTPAAAAPPIYYGCYKYKFTDAQLTNGSVGKIRVTDPDSGGTQYASTSNGFTVTGSITPVFSPSLAGTAWKVEKSTDMAGNTIELRWNYTGNIGSLELYYDKTGAFSGAERAIRSSGQGNMLSLTGSNGTACTPPGGGGCYILAYNDGNPDASEAPRKGELTHAASTAKFRLLATTPNPDVSSLTSGFEVRGWYDVTSPSALATWNYGTSQTIAWTTHGDTIGGTTGNVFLEYATNGSNWTKTVATATTPNINQTTGVADGDGDHSVTWTTEYVSCTNPEQGCATTTFRVRDKDTGNYTDVQGAGGDFNITVLPTLTLTNPSAGVSIPLEMESSFSPGFAWTIGGLLGGNVNLYYTTNNFGSQNAGHSSEPDGDAACTIATGEGICLITNTASGNSPQAWSVPQTASPAVKFRLASALNANIVYSTPITHRIHAKFNVTAPATPASLNSEENATITWTTTAGDIVSVPNVKIYYTTNNFSSSTLITTTTNDGDHPWAVPEALIHDNVKIRVIDSLDTIVPPDSASDTGVFSTKTKLTLVSPNGGEVWAIGSAQDIQWVYKGTLSNVKLELCTDGTTCSSSTTIFTPVAANAATGGCALPTPGANETAGCYRWNNATTGGVSDARGLTKWVRVSDIDPNCVPGTGCGTRPTSADFSDASFKIKSRYAVSTPNTAVQWDAGTSNNVQFTVQGTGQNTVDLHYSNNGGSNYININPQNITLSPSADGTNRTYTQPWTTPTAIAKTDNSVKYKVRVRDDDTVNYSGTCSTGNDACDASDVNFDLVARFDIAAPAANATWRFGDTKTLTWTTAGSVAKVNIQYFTGNLGTWTDIALDETNDGSYDWPIPDNVPELLTNDAAIRIIDNDSLHVLRTVPSVSGDFNVVPAFTVLQPPQAGSNWRAAQVRNIQWRVDGLATNANIKLWYSTDGSGWTEIDNLVTKVAGQNSGCTLPSNGTGTEGCYNWTIPGGAISATAYVKITDADPGHPPSDGDTANGVSTQYVVGQAQTIAVTVPAGPFTVNTTMDVEWAGTGPFMGSGNVRLEYSTNGSSYTTIGAAYGPEAATGGCVDPGAGAGCARITVPDAVSGTFTIRASDAADADTNHVSPNRTVNGLMGITYPTTGGGQTHIVDDVINITWTATGSTGVMNGANTTIEYDKDGQFDGDKISITTSAANGVNVTAEGTCTPAGSDSAPVYYGCYKWRIPGGTISDAVQAKIRVIDGGFTSASGAHTTTGSIAISAPTGADVWKAETEFKMDGSTALDVVWSFKGNNAELGTSKLKFDKTGAFSGSERSISTSINLENAYNGCTDPGVGAGCYRILLADAALASELTHGATSAKFRVIAGEGSTPNPDIAQNSAGFEVRGWYKITSPAVTATWLNGESKSIVWETHGSTIGGTTGKILLQYNTNSGTGGWTNLNGIAGTGVADSDGDANSFPYTVENIDCTNPDQGCSTVRLRIIDYDAGTILDQPGNAGAEFDLTVLPKFTALTPNNTALQIASSQAVAWTLGGTLGGTVDVFYSTNDDFSGACDSATGNGKCTVCLDVNAVSGNCGSNWAIPNITYSNNVKLKVVSDLSSTIALTQTAASRIHGKMQLSEPGGSGGQSYNSEENATISWSFLAGNNTSIPNVKLAYSTNDFSSSTLITTLASTASPFSWPVPEALIHNTIKVRVYDSSDVTAPADSRGDSVNAFSTKTKLRVISPTTGSEILKIGVPVDITWGYKGTLSTVNLRLCSGADVTTCATPAVVANGVTSGQGAGCTAPSGGALQAGETGGCYRWVDATTGGVSDNRGIANRIKIIDADADTVPSGGTRPASTDLSDNNFKIVPNIIILSPNTAVKWDANTGQTLQFQVQGTGMSTVDILYSDDSNTTYGGTVVSGLVLNNPNVPLAASLTTYSQPWTTPSVVSETVSDPDTKYRIKVEDPDNTDFDAAEIVSATDFDVVAKFTYTAPAAAANWQVGSNQTISWASKGTVNNVKLSWRTGLTSYATIVQTGSESGAPATTPTNGSGIATNAGSFVWQIPNTAGVIDTAARIRIEDADTGHILRTSLDTTANFDILPTFTMITPAGGETWDAGSTQNVQWRTLGPVSNVKLQYSVNGGGWTDFEDPAGGSITTIPNAQNGGCTLPAANGTETRACYRWKIHPNTIHASVKFRVVDVDGGHPDSTQVAGNGESVAFTIQKGFLVVQPNGTEQLTVGGSYDVKWEAYGTFGAGTVNLQYSGDNFVAEAIDIPTNGVPTNASNSDNGTGCTPPSPTQGGVGGCYRWNPVPNDIRSSLKIRTRENVSPNTVDVSNADWEIVGPLSVISPNGGVGQYYTVGSDLNIVWTNNPNLGRENAIDLEYSTNNFSGACNAATGAGACQVLNSLGGAAENLDNTVGTIPDLTNGSFSWRVPDNISDTVLVRIIRHDVPTTGDSSNNTFKIIGNIALATLNGSDAVWKMGDATTISWTRTGSAQGSLFNNFRIDFSTDNTFATGVVSIDADVTLAEASCAGGDVSCDYNWTPDASTFTTNISGTPVYYIRIMDPDQSEANIISPNKFELAGKTTLGILTSADGLYKIGTVVNIDWTKAGNLKATHFDNFKIEFSTDNTFATGLNVIDADVTFAEASCSGDDTCTYAWTPDAATYSTLMSTTADYYLRIYDPDNLDTKTQSNPNRFELRGDITLSTLQGSNAIYKIGTPVSIDWTKKGNAKVNVFDSFDIQFSTDNTFATGVTTAATLTFAAASCDADDSCTYSWAPDAATYSSKISSTPVYYFRVLEVQNDDTQSKSSNLFELRGDLSLDALPGTQAYPIGSAAVFTWTKNGNVQAPNFDNFTLQFSTDNTFATGVTSIITLSFAAASCDADNTCTYSWTPDAATYSSKIIGSKDYYLRVLDTTNDDTASSSVDFISNKKFKIIGRAALDALPGSRLYKVGTPVAITWARDGNSAATYFDNFRVQYSTDATFASGVNTVGTYTFTQAACDLDNSCMISWTPGDTDPIVPNKDYYLRVLDPDDVDTVSSSASFGSNQQFELAGDLTLTILASGDETYTVGTVAGGNGKVITWTKQGAANGSIFDDANLEYSTDVNFASSTPIATVVLNGAGTVCTGNNCSYTWNIPTNAMLTSTAVYYLRVVDPNNSDSVNVSSSKFKLKGGFSNLSPQVTDLWAVGSDQPLSWTTNGAMNNVKISFSQNGTFSDEKFLKVSTGKLVYDAAATDFASAASVSNTPNGTSNYTVTTPDYITSTFKIRLYDAGDNNIFLNSSPFRVYGTTALAALPGNQIYPMGQAVALTWTRTGTLTSTLFDSFALQFSTDNTFATGVTTITTLSFAAANCSGVDVSCDYTWTPDATTYNSKISATKVYYMRVIDTDDVNTASSSGATQFKIRGNVILDVLPGTLLYKTGTPVTFSWTRDGSVATLFDNFRVQYSTDSSFASGVNTIGTYTFTQSGCDLDTSCSLNWTPLDSDPIIPTKNYYLRVLDPDDTDTVSSSANFGSNKQFELAGDLALTILTAADATHVVGSTQPITWTKKGLLNGSVFDDVNLAYSTDINFGTSTSIATGVVINGAGTVCDGGGNCTFNWPIPTNAALTTTPVYYVRVIDPNNTDSVNVSTNKIKLKGNFTSLSPTVSDKWIINTDRTLTWTTVGVIANVKIAYSTDGFSTQKFFDISGGKLVATGVTTFGAGASIANVANGGSSYTMTTPDIISDTYMLRIYDANDANVFTDSAIFKVHPKMTLATPGGTVNEVKTATGTTSVTWTVAGTVAKAKFEYTLDGTNWNPITAAQSGSVLDNSGITSDATLINTTRAFTWTIPGAKSNNAFVASIRVSKANVDNTSDVDSTGASVNPFKVSAKFTVLSPNGENNPLWKVGETDKVITWSTTPANLGGANQVTLWYSANNGGAWTQIGAATGNDGSEPWNPIPDAVTNQALVRVMDSADANGLDNTDAVFSIAGNLSLTTLLGGEETFVYAASPASLAVTTPIQWNSQGSAMSNVLLQYSNDNFSSDIRPIVTITNNTVGANTYNWQVPDTIGSNWRVRVINNTGGTPAVESRSGSSIKILARFAFTSHNAAADKCLLGQACTISWGTAGSASDVKLEYSLAGTGGPWSLINGTASIINGGSVDWNVPSNLSPSTAVRYRVTTAQVGQPVPSAGNLEVSDVNSKVVAGFNAADIKARVNGSGNPFVAVGGQTWGVGQSIDFQYLYTGIVGSIKVYYTLNDFGATTEITGSITNANTNGDGTGSFSYLFTDLMNGGVDTRNLKFLITDAGVPDLTGNTTNGVTGAVKVKGVIAVTNPNAGTERWIVGQNATVNWTATGSVANVKIIYDDNASFLSPSTIIASTASTANVGGSYTFAVNTTNLPDLDTAPLYYKTIYVRVQDADGEGVAGSPIHGASQDDSNIAHKIVGQVVVTDGTASPQLNAKWPVGSVQTITWTTFGKVPSVDLYYDDDGLFNGNEVKINAAPIANNQGTNVTGAQTSYSWSNMAVNLPLTATYKIRVVDLGDNTTPQAATYKVTGDSAAFKIHGYIDTIVLTSPNGVAKHKASDTATITWNTTGTNLNLVDIQYRDVTNAYLAGAWQTIGLNHDNTAGNRGTKSWNIPQTFNSTNVEIRVKPADGTTDGFDVKNTLKFMPKITVGTIPNSSQLKIGTAYDIPWAIKGVVSNIRVRYSPDPVGVGYLNDSAPYHYVIAGSIDPNAGGYSLEGANAKVRWQDAETGGVEDTRSTTAKIKIELLDDVSGDADAESLVFSIQANFIMKNPVDTDELYVGDNFPLTWDWGGTINYVVLEISNSYTGTPASFDAGRICIKDFSRTDCTDPGEDVNQNGILDMGEDTNLNTVLDYGMLVKNGVGPSGSNFSPIAIQVQNLISRPGDLRGQDPYFIKISDPSDPNVFHIFPTAAGGAVTGNNGFKIKSKLDITSPDGGQDWYVGNVPDPNDLTQSVYKITWTHTGTVPNVVLEAMVGAGTHEDLDNDSILDAGEDVNANGQLDRILCVNGGTYPACNSIPNTNLYAWKIPDNGKIVFWNCNKRSDLPGDEHHPCKVEDVKVRVRDAADLPVLNASANPLIIRYSAKLWEFVNDKTGKALDSINLNTNGIHARGGYSLNDMVQISAIQSPFVIWNPAGTGPYEIEFKKDGFTSYANNGQVTVTTDQIGVNDVLPANSPLHTMVDEKQRVKLADILAHSDLIKIEYKYTDTTKVLNLQTSYSRDGVTVVTTRGAKVDILDGLTQIATKTLPVQNPELSPKGGIYDTTFTTADVTLDPTKFYTLVSTITIDDTPGQESALSGSTTLDIAPFIESQKTDSNVATITPIIVSNLDTKLSTAVNDIKTKLDDTAATVTNTLNSKIGTDPQGKTLMQKMDEQTTTITDAIDEFTAKSDDALFRMQDEITKGSIRVIVPDSVKLGSTQTLRVATAEAVGPTMDLMCPNGSPIMTIALASTPTPGIYSADVKFDGNTFKCAIANSVTVIANASIPSQDPLDPPFLATAVGRINVTSTDLDTIQGLAAAGLNAEKAAKDARDAVLKMAKALQGDGSITSAISNLQKTVDRLPSMMSKGESGMSQMKATLEEIASKMNNFVGSDGVDLKSILKQEIGEGMKGVRNKVDRTLVATEVMKDIIERKVGKSDEPIIQSFYEIG